MMEGIQIFRIVIGCVVLLSLVVLAVFSFGSFPDMEAGTVDMINMVALLVSIAASFGAVFSEVIEAVLTAPTSAPTSARPDGTLPTIRTTATATTRNAESGMNTRDLLLRRIEEAQRSADPEAAMRSYFDNIQTVSPRNVEVNSDGRTVDRRTGQRVARREDGTYAAV